MSNEAINDLAKEMHAHPMQVLFDEISNIDESAFREWARENYVANGRTEISNLWHPVVKHECCLMMMEKLRENMKACEKVLKLLEVQIDGKS